MKYLSIYSDNSKPFWNNSIEVISVPTKSEKKKKNDDKGKNPKTANPITFDTDNDMRKPVRGLPHV